MPRFPHRQSRSSRLRIGYQQESVALFSRVAHSKISTVRTMKDESGNAGLMLLASAHNTLRALKRHNVVSRLGSSLGSGSIMKPSVNCTPIRYQLVAGLLGSSKRADETANFVVRADQQEKQRVGIMTEDDAEFKSHAKFYRHDHRACGDPGERAACQTLRLVTEWLSGLRLEQIPVGDQRRGHIAASFRSSPRLAFGGSFVADMRDIICR
jgi:hypothetical protein